MAIKKDNLDQLLLRRDPKQVFPEDGLFDNLLARLDGPIVDAIGENPIPR